LAFLRAVEVFPPLFPVSRDRSEPLHVEEKVERFLEEVRSIRDLADVFLVAKVKNPKLLKLSTIEVASLLRDRLRVEAAPAIVVRDVNRFQFLSDVLTGITLEFRWMTLAWGDAYSSKVGVSNVRDFSSLKDAIRQADMVRSRARASVNFFAPVDVHRLEDPVGKELARSRLGAGANMLLAQPPTCDAGETFDRHASVLKKTGLKEKVLLNVFPFRDAKDIRYCERYFGWKLPRSLHLAAAGGEPTLLEGEREVVRRLRNEGFPGVYIATRGTPAVAERLLS